MHNEALKEKIVELYRKTATELPADVVSALKNAPAESSAVGKGIMADILKNAALAKSECTPICQDTGIPIFYVKKPENYSETEMKKIIEEATVAATNEVPLRPNAVDSISDKNLGNRPIVHFEPSEKLGICLMLKGGGSENVSSIYQLPNSEITAGRNLDGVRKCVLDAVFKAQGKGCPPYVLGIAIGGSIEEVAHLSKKQLLRKLDDKNPDAKLAFFEKKALAEINSIGIGPQGLGGKNTALGVKAASAPRHPASFFVGISISCWCLRRQCI